MRRRAGREFLEGVGVGEMGMVHLFESVRAEM